MNAHQKPAVANEVKEDLYYAVHKGIRFANARMLIILGSLDLQNPGVIEQVLDALENHLAMSLSHLVHENNEIHTQIERRFPGASTHAADDHKEHLDAFTELRDLAAQLRAATAGRPAVLRRLYQRFALFVADDLAHMHEEETELMPLIEANFSASEITAIRERIVGAIPPAEMVSFMRAILAASSESERVATVTGMHAGMPADVFSALMRSITGSNWSMGDWTGLKAALPH